MTTAAAEHAPLPPTGRQHLLRRDGLEAVVVETGAALRVLRAAGGPLLEGYAQHDMPTAGRGQLLMPWPNRVRDGRYTWDGAEQRLALSEPEQGNAIHGLVRWVNWEAAEQEEDRVLLRHRLHAQIGYPFVLDLAVEYALGPGGLTVRMHARNTGARACPFGAGAHPYLTLGTPTIDPLAVRVPARARLLTDERQIPVGSEPVEGTQYDLREPRELAGLELDTCYAELERDDDGLARVPVRDPGSGRGVTLWADAAFRYLMVFTGEAVPEPERRRTGLAVEPMTCAPNAFATGGDGLLVLAPGESFSGSWGIAPA